MKTAISVLLMLCALAAMAPAQDFEEPASREKIASWLDYATYKIGEYEHVALVEFYYGILRHQLTFEDMDSFYQATAYVWLEIFNDKGVVIDTLHKVVPIRIFDPFEQNNESYRNLDVMQALIKPGNYSVRMTIEDANSRINDQDYTGKYGERQIKITVPDYQNENLSISDIELAYKIQLLDEADTLSENPLNKSNRKVIPNPSVRFINTDSMMYFYAEIYNLKFGKEANKEYYVSCRVENLAGEVISNYGRKRYFKPGDNALISSAIDIYDLPEGQFRLILEVEDSQDNSITSKSKLFELLYETFEIAPAVAEEDFNEEDAKLMEKIIHFYAIKTEMDQYKAADLEGKKEILKRFWQSRDPDPSTHLNEFKIEAFRRFAFANEKYSIEMVDRSDGWKSDRGRVYIIYGPPDEIESYPSSMGSQPYERWTYHNYPQQGYIFFIFVDESGYGDYVLKHSTAKGELTDYEWERKLETADPFKMGY
jgi:GWxTD domain-containing protein